MTGPPSASTFSDESSLLLRNQTSAESGSHMNKKSDERPDLEEGGSLLQAQQSSMRQMAEQLVVALLIFAFGWYFPGFVAARTLVIRENEPPFQKTSSGDILLDFNLLNPVVDPPTVPTPFLAFVSFQVPIVLMILLHFLDNRRGAVNARSQLYRLWRLQARISGLLTSVGFSELATQVLKLAVQRRRPNFYALCGWDSEVLACQGSASHIREAHLSFPSGHSSLASSSTVFLMLVMLGAIQGISQKKKSSSTILSNVTRWQVKTALAVLVSLSWIFFVAASRLIDHWHHPADVLAGLLLGSTMGILGYHLYFPPIWSITLPDLPLLVHQLISQESGSVGSVGSVNSIHE